MYKCRPSEIIQVIFFIGLCVVSLFFMKEVIQQFISNDTSLKQKEVNITEYPTITICPKGPNNITYSYESDFTISLGGIQLKLGNESNEDNFDIFDIEYEYYDDTLTYQLQRVYSYEGGYFCYRINQTGYNFIRSDQVHIYVSFEHLLTLYELPDIDVYLTSYKNSDGVIFLEWMDGNELKFALKKVSYKVYFQVFHSYYEVISNTGTMDK